MFIHDTPAAFYGQAIKVTPDILEVCCSMYQYFAVVVFLDRNGIRNSMEVSKNFRIIYSNKPLTILFLILAHFESNIEKLFSRPSSPG